MRGVQVTTLAGLPIAWATGLVAMAHVWIGDIDAMSLLVLAVALLALGIWTFQLLPEVVFSLLAALRCTLSRPIAGSAVPCPPLRDVPRVALLYTTADDFSSTGVESLLRQTHPRCEVIILDDGRLRETQIQIDAFSCRHGVAVLRRESRAGYKAGNLNAALERIGSLYDCFVVLDGDTLLAPDFVENALGRLREAGIGFVLGRKMPKPGLGRGLARPLRSLVSTWYLTSLPAQVDLGFVIFDGRGSIVRVDAWRDAGGFPLTSTEDIALSMRLRARGWRGTYEPRAEACEDFPTSMAQLLRRNEKWLRGLLHSMFDELPDLLRSSHVSWLEKLDLLRVLVSLLVPLCALSTVIAATLLGILEPGGGDRLVYRGGVPIILALLWLGFVPLTIALWRSPRRWLSVVVWIQLVVLGTGLRNGLDLIAFLVSRTSVFGVTAVDGDAEIADRATAGRSSWWAGPKSTDPLVAALATAAGCALLVLGIELQSLWLLPFGAASLAVEALRVRHLPLVGWATGIACLVAMTLMTFQLVAES